MPHVEDALLVAYADDALDAAGRAEVEGHLVSCAECRARVAEERALAARAAEVLGRGAPELEVAVPPFAEIARRGEQLPTTPGGGAAGAPQRRHNLPPLAWAAMLVVGLGAAWIARTLLVSPAFNAPADAIRAERMESTAAEAAPMEPPAAESPATGAAGAAGATEEADARKAGVAADASSADEAPAAAREAAAAPAVTESAAETVRVAPQAFEAPPPPAPAPQPEAPVPLGEPVSQRYADAAGVRDSAQRGDTARVALRAAAAAAPAPAAAERAEAVADGAMLEIEPGDAAWVGTAAADAAAKGEAVRGITGAPVDLVWLGRPSASWRARVVQRVDGVELEVIEWRTPPAPAEASGTLADGRGYLVTTSDGVSVLLRGRISPDRLRALAERLTELP